MSRLGVNIDHLATLRQLRGTPYPDVVALAKIAEDAGAEQITVHLREDRRHIQDEDVRALKRALRVELNLEMALSEEIIRFAFKIKPDWVCIVPEKRRELTTEGGLDVLRQERTLAKVIPQFKKRGIRVSLFVEPSVKVVERCVELGADAVEIHTGSYAELMQRKSTTNATVYGRSLKKIQDACGAARAAGIRAHAGHGLDRLNIRPLAALELPDGDPLIQEYNVGHAVVCRAVEVGWSLAIREMISAITAP